MRFQPAICPARKCGADIEPDYKTPEGDGPYYLVGRVYICIDSHILLCEEDDNGQMMFTQLDPDNEEEAPA